MDPSKFTVRVTNPTTIRQQRFSDSSYLDVSETMNDYKPLIRYDKYETNYASWGAPRKVQPVDSETSSLEDDDIDKELRLKKSSRNLRNLRRFRASQRARRIEELSRPRLMIRRVPRSHENHNKVFTRQEKKSEIKTSSHTDLMAIQPSVIAEKFILRHRNPTDRIAKLAEPKTREPIAVNPLGKVDERALFAVASKRITELAIPKNISMTKFAPTEKQNPYGVSPQALRATCSPTIELLARPKKFDSSSSNSRINRR